MILLFVLAMSAMAEEPEDRSETIYKSCCVNCHGESLEKVPLNAYSSTEQVCRHTIGCYKKAKQKD